MVAATAANMGRELDTRGIKELLYRNYEHPRWDEVAARCLNCGNCTWVCPTCFCHTMEDVTDLTGAVAERWRRQDVCFTVDFLLHPRRQHPLLAPVPLPPVADPQAGHLDRPVRLLRLRRLRPLHHLVPGGHRHHRGSPGHPGNDAALSRRPSMETIEPILAAQPFFQGLDPRHISGTGRLRLRVNFKAGQFLCRAEEEARQFYLIHPRPGVGGDLQRPAGARDHPDPGGRGRAGLALVRRKPYHWHLDARAVDLTRVLSLEVSCLRDKCEADHDLGYELMKRYAHSLAVQFRVTSLQLMDMFQDLNGAGRAGILARQVGCGLRTNSRLQNRMNAA